MDIKNTSMPLEAFIGYLLASVGLTILIVWPEEGPSSWMREKIMRPLIPRKIEGMLDCYICLGFWSGLLLSSLWYYWYRESYIWTGCLMVPALFWIFLNVGRFSK